jgi:hypothetical protein
MKVELSGASGCERKLGEKLVFEIEKAEISLCKPIDDRWMWVITRIEPQEILGMTSNDMRELCLLLSETKSKKNKRRVKR